MPVDSTSIPEPESPPYHPKKMLCDVFTASAVRRDPHVAPLVGRSVQRERDAYRLTRWARLPEPLDRLRFRKAMARMSVKCVTLDWLETDSGLTRPETKSLLSALDKIGALEVTSVEGRPASPADRAQRSASSGGDGLVRTGLAVMAACGNAALQAVRDVLGRPIRIRRRGRSVEIVLDRAIPRASRVNEKPAVTASFSAQELCQLRTDLAALLGQHARAREVLMHLSAFEQVLLTEGPIAADLLPDSLQRKVLRQLQFCGNARDGMLGLFQRRLEMALRQPPPPATVVRV